MEKKLNWEDTLFRYMYLMGKHIVPYEVDNYLHTLKLMTQYCFHHVFANLLSTDFTLK